jgi:type II secretory pathway pseudopilin PulG
MDNNDFDFGDFSLNNDNSFDSDGGFGSDNAFGSDDLFGSSTSSNQGFGSDDFGFGESSSPSQNNAPQNTNSNQQSDFAGAFDDNANYQEQNEQDGSTKKNAIIIVVVGIVGVIAVLFLARFITNKTKQNDSNLTSYTEQVDNNSDSSSNTRQSENVDNIMTNSDASNSNTQASQSDSSTSVSYVQDENGYNWIEITDSENVEFNQDYVDMTFTVTNIKHYARSVDTNNNLVIKTALAGSISGLSGTYVIDVPYNKGVKLVVGDSFTVHVQLGSYNGKTVVGEISY